MNTLIGIFIRGYRHSKIPSYTEKLKYPLFLMCFPMNYRDFSVKINGESNSEITIFIFTDCKNGVYMNSRLKVLPRRFKM